MLASSECDRVAAIVHPLDNRTAWISCRVSSISVWFFGLRVAKWIAILCGASTFVIGGFLIALAAAAAMRSGSATHYEALRKRGPSPVHRTRNYGADWWAAIKQGQNPPIIAEQS